MDELIPYLPADRPHFFPGKMGPKLGLRLIRGYKRFDTSLMCTRTHGCTANWHFNVCFKLFLNAKSISSENLDFLCSNERIKFFNVSLV